MGQGAGQRGAGEVLGCRWKEESSQTPTESVFMELLTKDEPSDLWKGGKKSYLSNVAISRQLALAL